MPSTNFEPTYQYEVDSPNKLKAFKVAEEQGRVRVVSQFAQASRAAHPVHASRTPCPTRSHKRNHSAAHQCSLPPACSASIASQGFHGRGAERYPSEEDGFETYVGTYGDGRRHGRGAFHDKEGGITQVRPSVPFLLRYPRPFLDSSRSALASSDGPCSAPSSSQRRCSLLLFPPLCFPLALPACLAVALQAREATRRGHQARQGRQALPHARRRGRRRCHLARRGRGHRQELRPA